MGTLLLVFASAALAFANGANDVFFPPLRGGGRLAPAFLSKLGTLSSRAAARAARAAGSPRGRAPLLRKGLPSSPLVARSLMLERAKAGPGFRDNAKAAFGDLGKVVAHDPNRLVAHALVGALAFAVQRNDYALQHLLFVAHLRPEFGEAFYLGAVASSRNMAGERSRNDVLTIRWLQAATRAGFCWEPLSQEEWRINRLRQRTQLRGSLGRDLEAVLGEGPR